MTNVDLSKCFITDSNGLLEGYPDHELLNREGLSSSYYDCLVCGATIHYGKIRLHVAYHENKGDALQ